MIYKLYTTWSTIHNLVGLGVGGGGLMFENKWRESQTMRNGSHRFTIYALN